MSDPTSRRPRRTWRPDPEPIRVPVATLVGIGCVAWALALVATLLVPAWHTGDRAWWPWAAALGLLLGALGFHWARRFRANPTPHP